VNLEVIIPKTPADVARLNELYRQGKLVVPDGQPHELGVVLATLGGPGSGNFGHAGRPGERGGSASGEGDYHSAPISLEEFERQALGNAFRTFRTMRGTYDSSSAALKPQSTVPEGDTLTRHSMDNYRETLRHVWNHKDDNFTPESVRQLVTAVGVLTTRGQFESSAPLQRTFENKFYIPSSEIPQRLDRFSLSLAERLQSRQDAVRTAAYVEQELNHIHPWSDGVGRGTRALSAMTLAREGVPLPKYPAKAEDYYKHMQSSREEWERFYRTLIPGQKFRGLGGEGSGNFGHSGRPGEQGGSAPSFFSEVGDRSFVDDNPDTPEWKGIFQHTDFLNKKQENADNDSGMTASEDSKQLEALEGYRGNDFVRMNSQLRRNPNLIDDLDEQSSRFEREQDDDDEYEDNENAGVGNATDQRILNLANLLDEAPTLKEPVTVYRGLTGDVTELQNLKIGDEITLNGFQSSSFDPTVADKYATDGPLLEMKANEGLALGHEHSINGEMEFISQHGSRWHVAGVDVPVTIEGKSRRVIQLVQKTLLRKQ